MADKVHHEIDTFFAGLFHQLMDNNALYCSALEKGLMLGASHSERAKPEAEKSKGPKPAATGKEPTVCNAWGRTGHVHAKCNFVRAKHPDINPDPKIPFAAAEKGKAWIKRCSDGKQEKPTVSPTHLLEEKEFKFLDQDRNRKGKPFLVSTLMSIIDLDISGQTLNTGIKLTHLPTFHREVKALVDTGSLESDFIAPDI